VSRARRDAQLRRSITAKLEYVRRRRPDLLPGSGVTVQGEGIGATIYRQVARDLGLALVDANARIIVVTDLAQLEHWQGVLPGAEWEWEGNIALAST
jgi:hypothetical protein